MTRETRDGAKRRGSAWRKAGWGMAAFVLLLPLVAMQFSDEVSWDALDFVIAAVLIGGAGLGLEMAARLSASAPSRLGAAVAIAATLLLIWVNLAVGFLGSEDNPANLLFFGVLAVAVIGSALARFRSEGAARAMTATAAAQLLVGLIALLAGLGSDGVRGFYEAAVGTILFCALWLLSACLFRRGASVAKAS